MTKSHVAILLFVYLIFRLSHLKKMISFQNKLDFQSEKPL